MAKNVGVKVEGLSKVTRALKKYGVSVEDLKGAFNKIGTVLEQGAKSRTPVRSGKMERSIRQSKRQNSVYLYGGGKRAYWAPYVEFGTKYQRAQEPMQRTLQANKRWGLQQIEKEINYLISKYGLG